MFYMQQQILTPTERPNEQVVKPSLTQNERRPELAKILFNIKDTAHILSVSEKSVRRFLKRGLLNTNPVLRTKLIHLESIQAFARMTEKTAT